jgi:hypothetical protein
MPPLRLLAGSRGCTASLEAKSWARFATREKKRHRHGGIDRMIDQQISGQDRPDFDKPRDLRSWALRRLIAFLAPKPVTFIWGVGARMLARLARDGCPKPRDGRNQLSSGRHRALAAAQANPGDLLDENRSRAAAAEHALDQGRAKFGRTAMIPGPALDSDPDAASMTGLGGLDFERRHLAADGKVAIVEHQRP